MYSVFVYFKSAFDGISRATLWQKLEMYKINGNILNTIKNLYARASSTLCMDNRMSNPFPCSSGLRQGENLSSLLFSLYINDLYEAIASECKGLESMEQLVESTDNTKKINLLLYADDVVILCESPTDLQDALNTLLKYCDKNKLTVNIDKTKILVFSKGKVRKLPQFKYGVTNLEVVSEYTYLGVKLRYNGSFNHEIQHRQQQASRTMFSLLRKARKHNMPVDVQLHRFDSTIVPILLYGSEIWGTYNCESIERVQRKFLKIVLGLNRSTPNVMLYGENGRHSLIDSIQLRQVNFWGKLVDNNGIPKISQEIYHLMLNFQQKNHHLSKFITSIMDILNRTGMSHVWQSQGFPNHEWLKKSLQRRLADHAMQKWTNDLIESSKCTTYCMFKK